MTLFSRHRQLIVEWFAVANFAFLTIDIYLAHSVNAFRHRAEWIPFYFSMAASLMLLIELFLNRGRVTHRSNGLGVAVGTASILVGVLGLLLHLNSSFFEHQTIKSLVYTAPFAAPLAYTGLGLLLIMNRMVESTSMEWGLWLICLALGGFIGNFVLALCDHAQNGFFDPNEWIPVASAAFAVGFLATALIRGSSRRYLDLCLGVMLVQAMVGLLGFYFHGMAITRGTAPHLFENLIFVAPLFAPLLFPNLALLAAIGLWAARSQN